ncbi:hypothetical protein [Trueperella pyogenes]
MATSDWRMSGADGVHKTCATFVLYLSVTDGVSIVGTGQALGVGLDLTCYLDTSSPSC